MARGGLVLALLTAATAFTSLAPTRRPPRLARRAYSYDPITWALDITVPEQDTREVGLQRAYNGH